jgi:hypothetical protein
MTARPGTGSEDDPEHVAFLGTDNERAPELKLSPEIARLPDHELSETLEGRTGE